MLNDKSIIILFAGYSINNTPKIRNLLYSLKSEGYHVAIFGIVKDLSHKLEDIDTTHLYSKRDKQGILKIFLVFFYIVKLILLLVFFHKKSNIYAINPVAGIVALISNIFSSKKYIYESHEMVFGLNYPYFRGRWRHFWSFIEKKIILKAEYFFTTDAYRLRFIKRYYKVKKDNMGYILNVPNTIFNINDKVSCRKLFDFQDKFVISYCGGIISGRGIELIIEAYAKFQRVTPNTILLLAGSIEKDYYDFLLAKIILLGINNDQVIFTGKLENDMLTKYMTSSDITFALYSRDSLNNRMCSPNKVFDALHSNTYVISTNSFLVHDIIKRYYTGEMLDLITIDSILNAIKKYFNRVDKNINNKVWIDLQQKYCWHAEFKRVKEKIMLI